MSGKIYRKYAEFPEHPGKKWLFVFLLHLIGGTLLRLLFRVRVEGLERIPETGAVLLLPKHQRLFDIPLGFTGIVHNSRRDAWAVMKASLGGFGGVLLRTGGIPLDRKNPEKSKRSLLLARRVLEDGHMLVLFPEQTYYPGRMGRGKVPGFRFVCGEPAAGRPVQVVPLGIRYGKRRWLRTEVTMHVGHPVNYTSESDPAEFLYERMCEIANLTGLKYEFAPPGSGDESE